MITFLFSVLMILIFGKLAIFGLKAAWGITKLLVSVVLFPLFLLCLLLVGFVPLAFAGLLIAGIIALVRTAV